MNKKQKAMIISTVAVTGYCIILRLKSKKNDNSWKRTGMGFEIDFIGCGKNPVKYVRRIKNEIKFALQRVFYGCSEDMFWNMDSSLDRYIISGLRWLRTNKHGSPVKEGWTEENCHEEWGKILNEMIYHFEQSCEEYCSEKNEYSEAVDFDRIYQKMPNGCTRRGAFKDESIQANDLREKYFNREHEIKQYRQKHHEFALKMLNLSLNRFRQDILLLFV